MLVATSHRSTEQIGGAGKRQQQLITDTCLPAVVSRQLTLKLTQ